MWLTDMLERWGSRPEVVARLGPKGWECWSQRSLQPLKASDGPVDTAEDLPNSIDQLTQSVQQTGGSRSVSLVLESALAPAMLVDTGLSLLSEPMVHAYARNRLQAVYGGNGTEVSRWDVRVDWKAGERHGLAFGLDGRLLDQTRAALAKQGARLSAAVPSFAWGLARLRPWTRWPHGTGWWIWQEQDRQLVARLAAGRVIALHPALPLVSDLESIHAQLRVESRRWGIQEESAPIAVGAWSATHLSRIRDAADIQLMTVFQTGRAPISQKQLGEPLPE